jgi:hypothetical protein
MRRFIKDPKLAVILERLEIWWNKRIVAVPMPAVSRTMLIAALQWVNNAWQFQYRPDTPPTQETICHELMHLVLATEGWPIWIRPDGIPTGSPEHRIFNAAMNISQHAKVYKMVSDLRYSERAAHDPDIRSMVDLLLEGRYFHDLPPKQQTDLTTLYSVESLISHASRPRKRELRRILEKMNPKALERASAIVLYLETHQQHGAQENASVLQNILDIIQWQRGNPQPVFPDISDPGLFARMLSDLQ